MVVGEVTEPLWLTGVPPAESSPLRPTSTVRDVVQAAVATGLNQLLSFGPGVCVGSDPEDVHKSRVATRRMRSQLRALSVAVDETWLQEIRSELGWLAEGLGAVRDADVMTQRIQRRVSELSAPDDVPGEVLLSRLEAARGEAAQGVRTMLESDRCQSLVDRLRAAASHPPVLPVGSESAAALAPTLVSAGWRRLERSISDLPDIPSDDDLHEVRIRAKRCRYTAEILVPIMGGKSRLLAKALTELQGVLGDIHDSHCTQTWLRASACSTGEALASGLMIAAEASEHASLLRSWQPVWSRAQKVKPRSGANK